MFTINIYLKLAIIGVCIFGGIALAFAFGFWYAFPFFLIGLIFLASYIFLGTVQTAAQLVEEQQLDKAEKRLSLTLTPNWLYVTNRAYYYIMKGSIAMQKGDEKTAEDWFKVAEDLKLPSDNERAMIQLQLAGLYAKRNNWNKTKSIMRKLKKLDVTESTLQMQIDQFKQALKKRGAFNPSNMRQAHQMGRSKKRRRPKMR
jgi:tetratricopeptide (TPR) repeat protein